MEKKIKKYWKGQLDHLEKEGLMDRLDSHAKELETSTDVDAFYRQGDDSRPVPYDPDHILTKIHGQVGKKQSERMYRQMRSAVGIVAAVLAIVGVALLVRTWLAGQPGVPVQVAERVTMQNDIWLPSDSIPTLVLPNGDVRPLNVMDKEMLGTLEGIQYTEDSALGAVYKVQHYPDGVSVMDGISFRKLVFNSPKGYVNRLMLMDGTVVWLNSGSSLEYPMVFSKDRRVVRVRGEAYFDVAHDASKPFIVQAADAHIQVLGTSFNVASYQDEQQLTTTLIEGKVQLRYEDRSVAMLPGEQITLDHRDASWHKTKVNTADFTSWREGYFMFSSLTVPQILEKVKHWYDIDAIEINTDSDEKLSGTFKQTKSLRSLLQKLEMISGAQFDIKEGRVMVH